MLSPDSTILERDGDSQRRELVACPKESALKIIYHHRTRGDGAEGVHIREMANAMEELGHTVELCCPKAARRPPGLALGMTGMSAADAAGFKGWLRLKLRQSMELTYNAVSFFRVGAKILRCRPDAIYERYSCYHFGGVLAAKILRVPLCLEVNSTYAGRFPRRVLAFPNVAAAIERFALRNSAVVAVVSQPLKACVEDRLGHDANIVVTPNAINADDVVAAIETVDKQERRRSLGLSDGIVIGFVGSLRRWHGVDMLLKQIPLVREAVPNAKFLIVGAGELEQQLAELCARADMRDCVVATGGVSHEEALALIAAMDIGLMPHSNAWGSPMKILEYMAMGKVTIAPRLPPIEEIVTDGETGILFEPGNEVAFREAILRACSDCALRNRIGSSAKRFVLNQRKWTDNARSVLDRLPSSGAVHSCN